MTARDMEMEAAEYALGTVSADERRALEVERAGNPALGAAIDAWEARMGVLATGVAPQTPPKELWNKIDAALDALPDQRVTRVSHDEGVWIDLLPGVSVKVLNKHPDDGTETFLLKLAPGARVPPHRHPHTEECFVVEGSMTIGAAAFHTGDYIAYPAGVDHTEMFSPSGGTVLIRGVYA